MVDDVTVARSAIGAACAIFDSAGRVLLVHHSYGRLNWELPGGLVEPNEVPDAAARRELHEETGLRARSLRLTGVYFEAEHWLGQMLHFVFRVEIDPSIEPVASSPEITEVGFWPVDGLPRPISDFTEQRIRDALDRHAAAVARVGPRRWRE